LLGTIMPMVIVLGYMEMEPTVPEVMFGQIILGLIIWMTRHVQTMFMELILILQFLLLVPTQQALIQIKLDFTK